MNSNKNDARVANNHSNWSTFFFVPSNRAGLAINIVQKKQKTTPLLFTNNHACMHARNQRDPEKWIWWRRQIVNCLKSETKRTENPFTSESS